VEGANIQIEAKFGQGQPERLAGLVGELLGSKPQVIVTFGLTAAQAARAATARVPIVMAFAGDPVGARLVSSLARPGGNITGLSLATPELAGKRLEILKEISPKLVRLCVLGDLSRHGDLRQTQDAARALGLTVALVDFTRADGLDRALGELADRRPEAVLVFNNALTTTHRRRISGVALKSRWLLVSSTSAWPEAGALMSYAPSLSDSCRRAATYVDKILKGAKPADLPVEQPTKFELIVNLKTAKALGVTIPPSLLARADQVIE
jgi:putative tryptophan/tyrosine transport system substrate-binding protein